MTIGPRADTVQVAALYSRVRGPQDRLPLVGKRQAGGPYETNDRQTYHVGAGGLAIQW